MLQLTQPLVEPSTGQSKWRKLGSGKYFPTELPGAAGEDVAVGADPAAGQTTLTGPQVMAVEKRCLWSLSLSHRLWHGRNTPSDSSKKENFLRSRKKQNE